MDIKTISKSNLSEILDNAIAVVISDGDWMEVFPNVSSYSYFLPECHHDMEEHWGSFRGVDHVIANATVKYPELYPRIKELIQTLLMRNMIVEPFMSNIYEPAGTHYIVEMALKEKRYINLYVDFLTSTHPVPERFQCFDFILIVRQWDWCYETYYLLFARFFLGKESFDDDMDYLNYSVSSLMDGHFEDEIKRYRFYKAIQDYLIRIGFDPSDKDYNENLAVDFERMILKHISIRNFDFAKMMKENYLSILNNPEQEIQKPEGFVETVVDNPYIEPIEKEIIPEI